MMIDTGEQPGWRQLAEDGLPLGRGQATVFSASNSQIV